MAAKSYRKNNWQGKNYNLGHLTSSPVLFLRLELYQKQQVENFSFNSREININKIEKTDIKLLI